MRVGRAPLCPLIRPAIFAVALSIGTATVHAQPMLSPVASFNGGFAELAAALGDHVVGIPLTTELPGDETESVVQVTTAGAFYWSPIHAPTFVEPATSHRFALLPDGVRDWVGESLDPPKPEPVAVAAPSGRVACIVSHESQWNPNAVNPRSGASGLGQFLLSTWARTPQGKAGMSVFNPAANLAAIQWMIDTGQATQFDVVRVYGC